MTGHSVNFREVLSRSYFYILLFSFFCCVHFPSLKGFFLIESSKSISASSLFHLLPSSISPNKLKQVLFLQTHSNIFHFQNPSIHHRIKNKYLVTWFFRQSSSAIIQVSPERNEASIEKISYAVRSFLGCKLFYWDRDNF